MKGKVKWWNSAKGYGFITSEDGQDIFLHFSAIQMEGFRDVKEGQLVTFDIEMLAKGPSAANVVPEPFGEPETKPQTRVSAPSRPLRVFLCHSSNDKPAVRDLYSKLRSDQIDPWLDEQKLLPGQDWNLEITKAVHTSDVVLVCLSRGSVNKAGYIQKEIKYALDVADEQPEGTIFLIPLKLEECEIPDRLRRWQWVNLLEESGYERLMRSLQHRANTLGITLAYH